MLNLSSTNEHSSRVSIVLLANGTAYRVAKLGPDRLYLAEPTVLQADVGEVSLHIDDQERRWPVTLRPSAQCSQVVSVDFASNGQPERVSVADSHHPLPT